jgi:hypothetical protein
MDPSAEANRQKVVKFVRELLLEEADRSGITPTLISDRIDMVLRMRPSWGAQLDREAVIDELIRRFSLWIGRDSTLKNEEGHVAWLDAARKRDWRYWQRYREWLERKLSFKAVDALDRSTDAVLGLLEDPARQDTWDRRGLVAGDVQSGKTANYTGLICKAADAGYKIVIVLAGLHNNLRSQTQMRLDEGFLGYETAPTPDDIRIIGVGEIDSAPEIRPNYATNRSNNGDFNTKLANNLGISPEQRPWLFVVKKNKTVLERLLRWVRNHVANAHDAGTGTGTGTGRKIVTNLPLLMIDDEADHASVDTGEQVVDEDGRPDEEHQPTAINRLIRRLLHTFSRKAYVGFTATPFANIFIHERGETRDEGPDLFPAGFIINLAASSSYVGPAQVFGLRVGSGREGGLPLVRTVSDNASEDGTAGWMPPRHRNGHQPLFNGEDRLPPSLETAIDAFLLACATRRVRGQGDRHASMLIHVTRFNVVQKSVYRQVDEHLRGLRQRLQRRIGDAEVLRRLRVLWETDFVPTTATIRAQHPDQGADEAGWDRIADALREAVSDMEVRMINGTAKDALDYAEHGTTGLKVIAIGGDKLARGLTLEGLCVSYFLRASRMYDTLMQMGRWFGYRPGYLDLCRLYTTADLVEWFGHITDAAEELREEFDLMEASGATPRQYGLKVQSHPVLMVTSRLKMRAARNLMLSFSGQLVETVALYRDPRILEDNLNALKQLLSRLGTPSEADPARRRGDARQKWSGYLWDGVAAAEILDFLATYKTHPEAIKVSGPLLAEFIQSMASVGELTRWTVALVGGVGGEPLPLPGNLSVGMLQRSQKLVEGNRYSIGRLLSPRDEAIDLDERAWDAALAVTRQAWRADPARLQASEPDAPNGPAIRKVRGFGADGVVAHPERGVLLLYVLDPKKAEADLSPDTSGVVAFGMSFPGSQSGLKVEYKVNNVLWEQEYGSAE